MLSPEVSQKALLKMFRKKYIATIDEVFHVLDTKSRMSVFRRLKPIGYLTSFTDAGRYYTLPDIVRFDALGLWFYQDVGFSRAGTLKATVIDLVNLSEIGMTPTEALNLLRLRVPNSLHNTLHGLIKTEQLQRQRVQGLPLYTSIDSDIARKQMTARSEEIKNQSLVPPTVSIEMTIAVLVEALRAGQFLPHPSTVAAHITAQAMPITVNQVEQIFAKYSLKAKKKTTGQP
jgi:hypothetical protein